jgi:hypothetical protein
MKILDLVDPEKNTKKILDIRFLNFLMVNNQLTLTSYILKMK